MTQQLYALLDIKNNLFYAVHYNKLFIDILAELEYLHRSVCVIAFHDCINWHPNLIDNSNCHCWGLNSFFENSRPDALKFSDLFLLENPKDLDENQQILKANLESILKILSNLPQCSNYETSQTTLIMFAQDPWVQHARQLENQHYQNYKNAVEQARQNLQRLIKQHEVGQIDSIEKLKNKLNQVRTQSDKSFLNRVVHV
jgi:hypothetical protein